MTDWIEHPGGPQPVADDVSLYVWHPWGYFQSAAAGVDWSGKQRFRIINQHLIDAARLEGIRLGLEAAAREAESCAAVCTEEGMPETAIVLAQHSNEIAALDPTTIAREAVLDKLASEAQEQGMGYEKEADQ
jgi:hypothetical protein